MRHILLVLLALCGSPILLCAEDSHPTYFLWPPADQTRETSMVGRVLPARENEDPPAIRMADIDAPYLKRFDPPAEKANGTSIVIVPGGGYRYAVVGKEGAEVAEWLNSIGVTAFVLHYTTPTRDAEQDWLAPVQDSQRAIAFIRSHAESWKLAPHRIGIIGFSAGGNAAAIASTKMDVPPRTPQRDQTDKVSPRPDFTMLIYPWKLLNKNETGLREEVVIDRETPPTLLIHAHDDGVTSLSSIEYYKAMKRLDLPAELHLYAAGGHGYGLRAVPGTNIHSWTDRAVEWMRLRGLLTRFNESAPQPK